MENAMIKLFEWSWLIFSLPVGWCINQIMQIRRENRSFRDDFYETKIHAANTFVKHEDYRQDIQQLNTKMDRIIDKLEGKADK